MASDRFVWSSFGRSRSGLLPDSRYEIWYTPVRSISYIGDYILPGTSTRHVIRIHVSMYDTDSICSSFWYSFYGRYYWRQCTFEANQDCNIQFCMRGRGILILLQAWYAYKLHKSTFQTLHSTAVIILSLPRIPTTAYHFGGISQTILLYTLLPSYAYESARYCGRVGNP